jgi:putative membrane protein
MQEAHLFGLPQRLNSLGYLINILKTFVKIIKQLFFFVAYMVYKHRDIIFSKYVWFIILGLLLLVAIIALVNFRTFRYYVDEEAEEFVVQKGLFNKSKVVIKFSNILQVNITQNVIQKALSLYGLTLDTAGSDKVEVDLYALDGFHATELKKLLLSKIHGEHQIVSTEETDILAPPFSSDKTVLSLPAKNILLVSLFSNFFRCLGDHVSKF